MNLSKRIKGQIKNKERTKDNQAGESNTGRVQEQFGNIW